MRGQEFSHTKIKGLFAQNGQDIPITSQISKENFEIIKKLQKRRISLYGMYLFSDSKDLQISDSL